MNVVIDTNVLVSGIFWKGSPREILQLWVQDNADAEGWPVEVKASPRQPRTSVARATMQRACS